MGSVVTAQVVIAGNLVGQDDARTVPVLFFMLVFGAFIGLVNGLIVTLLQVPVVHRHARHDARAARRDALLDRRRGDRQPRRQLPADRPRRHPRRAGARHHPLVGDHPRRRARRVAIWFTSRPFGRTIIALGDNPTTARYAGARSWWVKTSDVHHLVALGDRRRHPARRLRRRAPVGRPRLRVHRHHGGRARRRGARRRPRLGRRRRGRGVRARGTVHPAELRRRAVDATATPCRASSSSSPSPTPATTFRARRRGRALETSPAPGEGARSVRIPLVLHPFPRREG